MNSTAPVTERSLSASDVDLLVAYLLDEEEVQEQLLDRLLEKERCLVKQDLEGLQRCLKEMEPVVTRLESCTHRRVRILRALGRRLMLPADNIQISSLLSYCLPADRERLDAARLDLKNVLVRIGIQNRKNHVLIKNGIEINEALVYALFGQEPTGQTYDRQARNRQLPPTRPFLNQEY